MNLLDSIRVHGAQDKRIELYRGDLTELSADEAFDLLVVSAFPNDYIPTRSSVIGALDRKGLSVATLARTKEVDLRVNFSCWLSSEFSLRESGLRFRRILCFEPLVRGRPPEVVADIFRALAPILAERQDIKSVALPVVAAGDQGYSAAEMLTPILDAALHWLENGLPLDCIKVITHSEESAREAVAVLTKQKAEYLRSNASSVAHRADYDVFISYSRANTPESEVMEQALRKFRPDIRIFVDRKEIDIGRAWQSEIFESLDRCRKVVTMLSPDYLNSRICKEEFNIAWMRAREINQNTIFPVYLYTTQLPTYMRYRNYIDCREGDRSKLTEASRTLLATLDEARPHQ